MTGPAGADGAAGDSEVDRWRDAASRGSGVLAGRRRRRAVARLARMGTPEAARALAEVFLGTTDDAADESVRTIARRALTALADPAAIDAACEVAIETGHERLQTLLGQAGHHPSDPTRRALWLFLTGRFDQAAELDYDGALLAAAHQAADTGLRRRIAEAARAAGRVEWVRAAVTETDPHRLAGLSDADWDTTLSVLTAARRFEELWHLATAAPLPQAARLLRTLAEHEWRPGPVADRDGYAYLLALADRCAKPPTAASLFEEARVLAQGRPQASTLLAVSGPGDLLARIEPFTRRGSLWRLPAGEPAGDFPVRETSPVSLAVSPDGSAVAIGNYDGDVRLQEPSAGRASAHLSTGRGLDGRHPCEGLAFTSDGEWLVGAGSGGRVWVWHVPSRRLAWSTMAHGGGKSPHLAMTPDGRLLATSGAARGVHRVQRGRVRLWHLPSGEPAGAVGDLDDTSLTSTVTPDGRRLVITTGDGGHIVELPSMERVAEWSDRSLWAHHVMSADGLWAVDALRHDTVEVRRTAGGKVVTRVRLADPVTGLALSHDRRLLAAVGNEGYFGVWHLPAGTAAGALDTGDQKYLRKRTLLFGADDALVAWTGLVPAGDRVLLWRPEPMLMGRTPVDQVTPAEAERLRERIRRGDDWPWGELLAALVQWRHRHDIDLADAGAAPAPAPTDIEASG